MMKKFRLMILMLLLLCLLSIFFLSCSFTINYDRYAVVYGISDYQGSLNDLNSCHIDAISMEELLTGQGYKVTLRIDSEATRSNLEADLAQIKASIKPHDLFVFFFSGHGGQDLQYDDSYGENTGSDRENEWIYLWGSIIYSAPYYSLDADETFNDDQLSEAISDMPCLKRVILIDACHSGGFIGNSLDMDSIPPDCNDDQNSSFDILEQAINLYANFADETSDISPSDALVISAAGEQEYSWESSAYGHGVFSNFLLKSATTAGDQNKDGFVTVLEAYAYIYTAIAIEWNLVLSDTYEFLPHVSGGPVDFVLFQVE